VRWMFAMSSSRSWMIESFRATDCSCACACICSCDAPVDGVRSCGAPPPASISRGPPVGAGGAACRGAPPAVPGAAFSASCWKRLSSVLKSSESLVSARWSEEPSGARLSASLRRRLVPRASSRVLSLMERSCGPASRLPRFLARREISSDDFLISFKSRCTSLFTAARSSDWTKGSLARCAHDGTEELLPPPQSWNDMLTPSSSGEGAVFDAFEFSPRGGPARRRCRRSRLQPKLDALLALWVARATHAASPLTCARIDESHYEQRSS